MDHLLPLGGLYCTLQALTTTTLSRGELTWNYMDNDVALLYLNQSSSMPTIQLVAASGEGRGSAGVMGCSEVGKGGAVRVGWGPTDAPGRLYAVK